MSLVDPTFDLVDPNPDLHSSFVQFNKQFFDGKLVSVEVSWSKRMTVCAGLCSFQPRSGYCSIRMSEPLLKFRPRKDFVETLLHEMIHAFLFLTSRIRDRDGHGAEFQFHMHRINKIAGTKITIYHSFHAEVAMYKQHWWRCEGKCREMKPFYGWVKRSMNRAPSKNDLWWATHERMCGGKFVKVKEPEPKAKAAVKDGKKRKKEIDSTATKMDKFLDAQGNLIVKKPKVSPKKSPKKEPPKSFDDRFPGSGFTLGGVSSTPNEKPRSRLIDEFFTPTAKVKGEKKEDAGPSSSSSKQPPTKVPELVQLDKDDFSWDDDDIIILDPEECASGSSSTGKSSPTDEPGPSTAPPVVADDAGGEVEVVMAKIVAVPKPEIEVIGVKREVRDDLVDCPCCTVRLPLADINAHLDSCVS